MQTIDRDVLYESLMLNDELEVKKINLGEDKFSYFSVENVLKTPEKAKEMLMKWPALDGGVYTPGARQNFTPMDIVPLLTGYKGIIEQMGGKITPYNFITSSIMFQKGQKVWKNSWYPHTDYSLVCNLWLSDYGGGTAFYSSNGKCNKKDVPDYKAPHDPNEIVEWENFEGNDDWEKYHVIPSKYNTLVIYDGTNFHGTYATLTEELRYSIISFYREDVTIA